MGTSPPQHAQFPPNSSPVPPMTLPLAASLCAAWTWDASEIVYIPQVLVLLEDSQ